MNKKIKVLLTTAVIALGALSLSPTHVFAAKGDQGVDESAYQGYTHRKGYASDKFGIAQVGGTYGGYYVNQATYESQVSTGIAQGVKMHTYIWDQVGNSIGLQKAAMDHFLPMIKTPKGSIVALDYEAGASSNKQANTNAILYGMARIKAAGYTPMYYSYKPYTLANVNYEQIVQKYGASIWIAAYPYVSVQSKPDFNYFPSLDGVAIWQFTDKYVSGGLDGNVALTGITDNGYSKSTVSGSKVIVKPKTTNKVINAEQKVNTISKSAIKAGYTVKINFSASRWATGQYILSSVKGKSYRVQQVSGNRLLLGGVMSWINRGDVEIVQRSASISNSSTAAVRYTVRYGDSFWSIANRYGINMYTLAAQNGRSINSVIYPGQSLVIKKGATIKTGTVKYYKVVYGDSFWAIAQKYGTTMNHIAALNGKGLNSTIYPGETLRVK